MLRFRTGLFNIAIGAASLTLSTSALSQSDERTSLNEISQVVVPSNYTLLGRWSCEGDTVYSLASGQAGQAKYFVRIGNTVENVFDPSFRDKTFGIVDAAPAAGSRSELLVYHLPDQAPSSGSQPYIDLVEANVSGAVISRHQLIGAPPNFNPTRISTVSPDRLLILGLYPATGLWADSFSLFSGVFDKSGNLVKELKIPLRALTSEVGADLTKFIDYTGPKQKIFNLLNGLQFVHLDADHVGVILATSMNLPRFGTQVKVFVVSSRGEEQLLPLPSPPGSELFAVTAAGDTLLALWGDRTANRNVDDLWQYAINVNATNVTAEPVTFKRKLHVLGRPLCVNSDDLRVWRPDPSGNHAIVSYSLSK